MNEPSTQRTKLEFIKKFINIGISIMPLYHRSKGPILSTWLPYTKALPTEQEIATWFPTDWCNYGVIAGWQNLVIIDFDNIEYFNIWSLCLQDTQYVLNGFKVRTRQGMHVYLMTETPSANDKRISKSGGIDVQAQGKYVVGPLCIHPSGHVYEPIGEMVFPVVSDIESILPLDLFPRAASQDVVFTGVAPTFASNNTEYQSLDVFAQASMAGGVDLISKVKASVRIEDFYPNRQRSSVDGKWFKALCPFHDDHKYSAWIDVQRQLAGCQVCGMKPMDVINLFARMHNISERAAVVALAEEVGVWR